MLNPLGTIFGVVIALFAGVFGIVANSSEFGPEGPPFETFLFVVGFYVVVSLIIGALADKKWKISILSSWGSVSTGFLMLPVALDKGPVRYAEFYFTGLVIVPLICLLFGYLGSILSFKLVSFIRDRLQRRTGMAKALEILAYVCLTLFLVWFGFSSFLAYSLLGGFRPMLQSIMMYSWMHILFASLGILFLILARHLEKRKSTPNSPRASEPSRSPNQTRSISQPPKFQ